MKIIRIVLAEDHPLMREGTRRILEQYRDLMVVSEAEIGFIILPICDRGR
jgi:DNA-binding NarL/FixJ family response regulator